MSTRKSESKSPRRSEKKSPKSKKEGREILEFEEDQISDALKWPSCSRLEGKVAVVTGAARGQGRSHAIRLTSEGVTSILLIDICAQIETVDYPMSTEEDLKRTQEVVQEANTESHVKIAVADTRDLENMKKAISNFSKKFGKIDIIAANAGIYVRTPFEEGDSKVWKDIIDTNLTGTRNTITACLPFLNENASIIITSSVLGLKPQEDAGAYTASKHGLIGLMKVLAKELASKGIRVNAVCPTTVLTPMIASPSAVKQFTQGNGTSIEDLRKVLLKSGTNTLKIPWVEPLDVSNAIIFLASDEARYLTGVALPVDAGNLLR
jgi:(+)-trans-carveol dehydrogenase